MPRDQEVETVAINEWVQLTNSDVTAITFQVLKGSVYVRIGDATPPAVDEFGLLFGEHDGKLQRPLSEISYADGTRVWARGSAYPSSRVLIDHA